ncbi:MAG: transglycosylase SLT domain-containing protein, partial [Deltaproteobacteria bacterium]|nr:transglycosylase SLT domain-containing protein [Deltaproteobacteria bacterium]
PDLANMAFVESMFIWDVQSKVGAAGMWQFMPKTAMTYGLRVDKYVDERLEPFLAARAATRLLKHNYEVLGTWPLAINAYNSGRGSLLKAVETVGSKSIAEIILNYRGGIYGFASRNFYPSFLAILRIQENPEKYFGPLAQEEAEYPNYLELKKDQSLQEISKELHIPLKQLKELNRHYKANVLEKGLPIPAGYRIRIPIKSS